MSDRRIASGRLAIVLTVSAWVGYVAYTVEQQFLAGRADSSRLVIEAVVYLLVVTALAASAIAYLTARIGFFYRSRAHRRAPRVALDEFFDQLTPSVTVLVPSYQEDARVIRTTLLSAALQEQPGLRVVLLVDDPHVPRDARARDLLEQARRLPGELAAELSIPAHRFALAQKGFRAALAAGSAPTLAEVTALAGHYEYAVEWLRAAGARHEIVDHTDQFFVDHVLGALAGDLQRVATALRQSIEQRRVPAEQRLWQLHRRLVSTFGVQLSSFERKRYVSLSHEPNKAMNLNSYIGLMGGAYREAMTPLGLALLPCDPGEAELVVSDPDYVLTLDADSVLLPEYCARLVQALSQGANARQGVAQTPYSAFPGAATRIERISGATTDLQHILHQGMTHYGATFWVGANAVLRKAALDEIVQVDYDGDWEIRRYISDRTVIEDTESTIDLGIRGWSLLNYPERLAYSATPPDFGSLCIQRQRWANGGLLILSKLREQVRARRQRGERTGFGELFLRVNYMASIFWSSVCLVIMLAYPFNAELLNPILLLISVPYFLAMASDLRFCGYKRLDVLRIYGFNLILLPVNLSGSFASILQLLTGEKSAFRRTPKVRNRTTAGTSFLLLPWVLIALSGYTIWLDLRLDRWVNLAFASLNAVLAFYAVVAFVGLGNTLVDLWVHLRGWLYRPVPQRSANPSDLTQSLELSLLVPAAPAGGSTYTLWSEGKAPLGGAAGAGGTYAGNTHGGTVHPLPPVLSGPTGDGRDLDPESADRRYPNGSRPAVLCAAAEPEPGEPPILVRRADSPAGQGTPATIDVTDAAVAAMAAAGPTGPVGAPAPEQPAAGTCEPVASDPEPSELVASVPVTSEARIADVETEADVVGAETAEL
ncbi:MAG TPA: glycosyltransferase family 2 protein [Kineosporiaceae bacterium]|nr:glycosyltransferase family 2 protein [Kineosporiaceae bacterium]